MSYATKVRRQQGGEVLEIAAGGKIIIETTALMGAGGADPRILSPNLPGAPAGSGVAVEEQLFFWNRTKFTLVDVVQSMVDATTAGCHGNLKIYDFPEGLLVVLGIVASATVVGAAGISASATVLQALGTGPAATDNATLVGSGEADLLASNSASLSSGSGSWGMQSSGPVYSNGVQTPKDMYLNSVVADADSSGNGTLTYNGTIWMVWGIIGDR